ncbi:KLH33 protein, partial [Atractosteus spatula]|nr:KLH33 protein [Atractosteus spatula]
MASGLPSWLKGQVPADRLEEEEEGEKPPKVCRNEGYPVELFRVLEEFRRARLLTDLSLRDTAGECWEVHAPVVAAVCSLVRDRLRCGGGGGSSGGAGAQGLFLDTGTGSAGLAAVLEFAYTGDIARLDGDTAVAAVRAAAETLGAPRVLELCRRREKQQVGREGGDRALGNLLSIAELWAEGLGCDVVLEVDGRSFHAHRVMLAAGSDYFRGMFSSGMRESSQSSVTLLSPAPRELSALLSCLYSGALELGWGTVFELTHCALQLQARAALPLCLGFLRREMDVSSCLDVAAFAEAYGMAELRAQADDFVLRNFQEVGLSPKFQDLGPERVSRYLAQDSLCAPSELAVFRVVVNWIQADPGERLGLAEQLMKLVRFPLMTFREFREVRAVEMAMEQEGSVELYQAALREFGFTAERSKKPCRVRQPHETLVLVGGDTLAPDFGQRTPSRDLWFANALRTVTGLVKEIEWRQLVAMPAPARFRHGLAVLDNRLYVFGGSHFYGQCDVLKSAYRYDPCEESWQRLADMQEPRNYSSVAVRGGLIYVLGGDRDTEHNLDSVECYDPISDRWRFAQPLDQAMSGQAVSTWEGEIYVSGGFNCRYQCLVSLFHYHPETGTTYLASMTQERAEHVMETLGGRLYVAGGVKALGEFYTDQLDCEAYDPHTDAWARFASLRLPHVNAASAVLEGKLYILGGYCQEDYSESTLVHRYDPGADRWESMGKMPGPNTDIRACILLLPTRLRQ